MDSLGKLIQSLPQSTASRLPVQNLSSAPDLHSSVKRCARALTGCYRRDDAADPEAYAAALIAVLAEYPIEVVEHVTDPRTGLPRTAKFLPSVAEVVAACEERMAQRAPKPHRTPLGKVPPPTPVNPNMWNDANARAMHERDYRSIEAQGQGGHQSNIVEVAADYPLRGDRGTAASGACLTGGRRDDI
jgi:hypothetical protein